MSKFESKLSAFGKQRYAETATQLRPIVNSKRRHISIAWITTPAAAFAGIIIGLGIQMNTNDNGAMVKQKEQPNTLKKVIELPEYCCYDQQSAIELPKFEYIVKQL